VKLWSFLSDGGFLLRTSKWFVDASAQILFTYDASVLSDLTYFGQREISQQILAKNFLGRKTKTTKFAHCIRIHGVTVLGSNYIGFAGLVLILGCDKWC